MPMQRQLGVSNPQGEGCDGKELEAALKGLRRAAWRASAERSFSTPLNERRAWHRQPVPRLTSCDCRNEPAKLKLMRDTFRAIEEKSRKVLHHPAAARLGLPLARPCFQSFDPLVAE